VSRHDGAIEAPSGPDTGGSASPSRRRSAWTGASWIRRARLSGPIGVPRRRRRRPCRPQGLLNGRPRRHDFRVLRVPHRRRRGGCVGQPAPDGSGLQRLWAANAEQHACAAAPSSRLRAQRFSRSLRDGSELAYISQISAFVGRCGAV